MGFILLFLAVLPVVAICTYIYTKDKNKEPGLLLAKLFLLGIGSCFLVLILSGIVFKILPFMDKETTNMTFFEIMAYAFIGVALIEEFCKWLMTYLGAYKTKSYDEVYDGIVYAVYVSLGFAFFENILYIFRNASIIVGISRGILAVPGHACDAVFMGYYLSLAKVYAQQGDKKLEKRNLILSVMVPTILHGIYDFCLFSGIDLLLIVFLVFVVTVYLFSFKKIKQLSSQSRNAPKTQYQPTVNQQVYTQPQTYPQQSFSQSQYINSGYVQTQTYQQSQNANNFCPQCGAKVVGNYCQRCGRRQN